MSSQARGSALLSSPDRRDGFPVAPPVSVMASVPRRDRLVDRAGAVAVSPACPLCPAPRSVSVATRQSLPADGWTDVVVGRVRGAAAGAAGELRQRAGAAPVAGGRARRPQEGSFPRQ